MKKLIGLKYFIPVILPTLTPLYWRFISSELSWLYPDVQSQAVAAVFVALVAGVLGIWITSLVGKPSRRYCCRD